jgi:tetratricopeptide (TPR) repeat protein
VPKDHPRERQSPSAAPNQAPIQQVTVSYNVTVNSTAAEAATVSAHEHYSRASTLREQRRFAEALVAYERAIALQADHAEAHNGRAIVLATLHRPAEAIAGFDQAIALKPDYAEAYNNRGLVLQELKRLDEALASFDKAIVLQPNNAKMHSNRGSVLYEAQRFAEALASFDNVIAFKEDYPEAHYNRGVLLQAMDHLDAAVIAFDRAIALNPRYAEAYNNRGVVLQDLRHLDRAVDDFEKAIALSGGLPEAYANKSYCLLLMGRMEEGWRLHEWRKKTPIPVGHRSFPQPLWLGREDVANKIVFLHWEQGLGDTIQFSRYAKLLRQRGATVFISVQEPLYRLLGQLSPHVEILKQDDVPAAFHYHCPMMSLPLALATTLDRIPSQQPYLVAEEQKRQIWRARIPPWSKPRIGFVWRGNTTHKNDRNRSIDLATLRPLFSSDFHWWSLQRDLQDDESALLREHRRVAHYGNLLEDFSDTAAVIDLLDLVVAVDTSVAHLAGAMGKPVWILLPYNSDWRWLCDREDSPWYPTARLFRQEFGESWEKVIGRVQQALCDLPRSSQVSIRSAAEP